MMKKLHYKDYNEQITTCDNGNVQSHDKEKSAIRKCQIKQCHWREQWCSYTYKWPNNKKSPFNKNNVATIKTNKTLARSYY